MTIIDTIAAKEGERNRIAALAGKCSHDRAKKARAIADKERAVEGATNALADALVAVAIGTAELGAEAAARSDLTSAEKALAAEHKADDSALALLAAQETRYAEHVAKIEMELGKMRTTRKEAHADAQAAALPHLIDTYTSAASVAMEALARAYALHLHLSSIGRDPSRLTPGLVASQLGSFLGAPVAGDIGELVQRERLRLAAETFAA